MLNVRYLPFLLMRYDKFKARSERSRTCRLWQGEGLE